MVELNGAKITEWVVALRSPFIVEESIYSENGSVGKT
jgi:hypothetical protein